MSLTNMPRAKVGTLVMKALTANDGGSLQERMASWKSLSDADREELIDNAIAHPDQVGHG